MLVGWRDGRLSSGQSRSVQTLVDGATARCCVTAVPTTSRQLSSREITSKSARFTVEKGESADCQCQKKDVKHVQLDRRARGEGGTMGKKVEEPHDQRAWFTEPSGKHLLYDYLLHFFYSYVVLLVESVHSR